MIWKNYVLADAISLASTVATDAVPITQYFGLSLQLVWTGTPAGDFTVEYSNDDVTYVADSSSSSAAGGAAGTALYNVFEQYSKYARVKFTRSGGTGTLTVVVNGKGF